MKISIIVLFAITGILAGSLVWVANRPEKTVPICAVLVGNASSTRALIISPIQVSDCNGTPIVNVKTK